MYICRGCNAVYNEESLKVHPDDPFKICPQWKCVSYLTSIDEDLVPIAKALKKKGYLFESCSYGQPYQTAVSLKFTTILNAIIFPLESDQLDKEISIYFFGADDKHKKKIVYDTDDTHNISFDILINLSASALKSLKASPDMALINAYLATNPAEYRYYILKELIGLVRALPDLSDDYLAGVPISNLLS